MSKKATELSPVKNTRDLYAIFWMLMSPRTFFWHLFLYSSPPIRPPLNTHRDNISLQFQIFVNRFPPKARGYIHFVGIEALVTPQMEFPFCSTLAKLSVYSPKNLLWFFLSTCYYSTSCLTLLTCWMFERTGSGKKTTLITECFLRTLTVPGPW